MLPDPGKNLTEDQLFHRRMSLSLRAEDCMFSLDDSSRNCHYLHNMAEAMRMVPSSLVMSRLAIIIQLQCYLVFSKLDYMGKFDFSLDYCYEITF
jgi:hypothetical protein